MKRTNCLKTAKRRVRDVQRRPTAKGYWGKKEFAAAKVIDAARFEHKPSKLFALFSGGHDSLAATCVASKHPLFRAAVHINTGIGIPETREFVRETCKREGWPLLEFHAKDYGQDYESLVLERGFPGPPHHYKMYNRLKERCLDALLREQKDHRRDRLIFATGCRSEESSRRMGHVEPIQNQERRPCLVWVAPIHDWTKTECLTYIRHQKMPFNEVAQLLHGSKECLCGAFAHRGELDEIALWYPETAAYIRRLEKRVKAKGFDWGWEGRRPPGSGSDRRDASGRVKKREGVEMLCTRCVHDEENRDGSEANP